jgi:hypothetical protein
MRAHHENAPHSLSNSGTDRTPKAVPCSTKDTIAHLVKTTSSRGLSKRLAIQHPMTHMNGLVPRKKVDPGPPQHYDVDRDPLADYVGRDLIEVR